MLSIFPGDSPADSESGQCAHSDWQDHSAAADRHRQGAPPRSRVLSHGGCQVLLPVPLPGHPDGAGLHEGQVPGPHQTGPDPQPRTHPRLHPLARNVARGTRGW